MSGNANPPPDVDLDGSAVAGARNVQLSSGQKFGVALLIAVILLGFIWLRALNHHAKEAKQPDVAMTTGQDMHPAPTVATPPAAAMPMPAAAETPVFRPAARHEMTPAESPIFAFAGGAAASSPAALAAPVAALPDTASAGSGSARPAPENALSSRLRPTVLSGVKARLLPHPDMLVTEGTLMPCILQTAIDSQLAGYVKCVLPVDIRGTTGNVVLMDKGTTVVGEVQQGLVNGQSRVFVLWDRAETPDHAIIELSSPGTDELGRSGLPGRVNNHWWQRFGDAILLSVIEGGLNAGTAAASGSGNGGGGGTSAVFNSFQSNGTSVANTALQAEINIPPTLEKNQGDTVAIFVNKDLDFSDIYDLKLTGGSNGQ